MTAPSSTSHPKNLVRLDQPVTTLRGVGPRRAETLAKLGISCVGDVLDHLPRRYEDRRQRLAIADVPEGAVTTVVGCVARSRFNNSWRARRFTARIEDESGWLDAVWLNGAWRSLAAKLSTGVRLSLYGRVEAHRSDAAGRVMFHPEIEVLDDDAGADAGAAIVPVYPSVAGLSQKVLRGLVRQALESCATARPEVLPASVRERYDLAPAAQALRQVHAPQADEWESIETHPKGADEEAGRPPALRRFLVEEIFVFELAMQLRRRLHKAQESAALPPSTQLASAFIERLPFTLTPAQRRALQEVERDLQQPHPMHRLLQGDVGSGKTVVAVLAMLRAVEYGAQAAFLAPTEVLAEQHAERLDEWLTPLGVRIARLTGSVDARQRRTVLDSIASGACQLVVGTHALYQEAVKFAKLAFVVIDEQHRFGVAQRLRLVEKGRHPHLLVMTATPIPRSLALTLSGLLEVSWIDRLPAGRPGVETQVLPAGAQAKAWLRVHQETARGRQAYVVCPQVDGAGDDDYRAARRMVKRLQEVVFRDLRVGVLHGRQPSEEKLAALRAFQSGALDVLVSTTVVEVGLDIPNATAMVIVDADRFGLAQLHQLRGRIGRGRQPGICLALCSAQATEDGRRRLATFAACSDGFELAEFDLDLRGPGEVLGLRQAGMPPLRLADLRRDRDLAARLREEASGLLRADPLLERPEHAELRRALERYGNDLEIELRAG